MICSKLSLKASLLSMVCLWLSGCSTLDGFFTVDDGAEMAETLPIEDAPIIDPQQQAIDQQEIRMDKVENALSQLLLEQRSLAAQMEVVKNDNTRIEVANLEAQTIKNTKIENTKNEKSADGMAIHLASYELENSIEPGWQEITEELPDYMKSKQVRIYKASVGTKEFFRLLLGPYNTRADARDACTAVSGQLKFCEVVSFRGTIFK